MKARPRSVEREVAAFLSRLLSDTGNPIERIPAPGRTGPDLTYHPPLNLIIDVKSRLKIPACMLADARTPFETLDSLYGIRLEELLTISTVRVSAFNLRVSSQTVVNWWNHMDEWTKAHEPTGISAIILHRPRMPIGHATVIIKLSDRSELCLRLASLSKNNPTPS